MQLQHVGFGLACSLGLLCSSPSPAAILEYRFQGVWDSVDGPAYEGFLLQPQAGDVFRVTVLVDSDTPDAYPLDEHRGVYRSSMIAWSLEMPGQVINVIPDDDVATHNLGNAIWIADNGPAAFVSCPLPYPHPNCDTQDGFTMIAGGLSADSGAVHTLYAEFSTTFFLNTLSNDGLPSVAPNLEAPWSYGYLALEIEGPDGLSQLSGSAFSEAQLATIVPIPAAAWLFGGALGLLGIVRRRSVAVRGEIDRQTPDTVCSPS